VSGGTDTFTFNWDGSFSEVVSVSGASVTYSGTYTHDTSAKTIEATLTGTGGTASFTYSISGSSLTLTSSSVSYTYTKQ